jgi:hypothetical protein
MSVRLHAATGVMCPGSNANGMLPSDTALNPDFGGTDVAMVAGPPDWGRLTASGELSCNVSAANGSPGQSSEERIYPAFTTACTDIAAMLGAVGSSGVPYLDGSNVKCTAACLDYVSNLGACQASNNQVQQVGRSECVSAIQACRRPAGCGCLHAAAGHAACASGGARCTALSHSAEP